MKTYWLVLLTKYYKGILSSWGIFFLFLSCAGFSVHDEDQNHVSEDELSESEVLESVFGNYDASEGQAVWAMQRDGYEQQHQPYLETFFYNDAEERIVYSRVIENYRSENMNYFVISTVTDDYQCRICAPLISIASFRSISGKTWRLESVQDLDPMGSYGDSPDVKIQDIGAGQFAFRFTTYYLHMGIEGVHNRYYSQVSNKFKNIFSYNSHESNEGACYGMQQQCVEVKREVEFLASEDEGGYYILELNTLRREFTVEDGDKVYEEAEKTSQRYQMKAGLYELYN